jgi:hypothetical protein
MNHKRSFPFGQELKENQMVIRESNNGYDYVVHINVSAKRGDRSRIFERNNNYADVPLVICYNMGVDLDLRTDAEKRARVMSMLKMLRAGVEEVVTAIGRLIGAKLPDHGIHEMGEAGGPIAGGRKQ